MTRWLIRSGTIVILALMYLSPSQAQNPTQMLLGGYQSWSFDPQTYGNGSVPSIEFGLFQRPFDLFQFNQPVLGSVEVSNGGAFTASSTTAFQWVIAGRTDQVWTMVHNAVRMTFAIPAQNNGTATNGGQLIIGQVPYSGSLASYGLKCESSSDNSTWTTRNTATITTAWGQMSVPFASTDTYLRVTIAPSSNVIALSSIKFMVFSPSVNTNNNQPFYNDVFGNIQIGAPTAVPVSQFSPTRLQVQGATPDLKSNALWVSNSNGTSSGNNLFVVRDDGAVTIDSETPASCGSATCALTVNGSVSTKEVVVTSAIQADYVFKPDYRLAPLSEVKTFINKNRHLPEIPSAAEVDAHGMNLGEMQTKLLAKIEELTLHLIEEDETNRELQQRITRLEKTRPTASK